MKRALEIASDTILIVALFTLFVIPVLVFDNISAQTPVPTVARVAQRDSRVLGVSTEVDIEYTTELIPQYGSETLTEEITKTPGEYSVQFLIAPGESREEELIRIVNTSNRNKVLTFSVKDNQSKGVNIMIDDTSLSLEEMEESNISPSITLSSKDWVTLGINVEEEQSEPATFTVTTEFSE